MFSGSLTRDAITSDTADARMDQLHLLGLPSPQPFPMRAMQAARNLRPPSSSSSPVSQAEAQLRGGHLVTVA
jgi:hypothetical protein